MTAKKPKRRPVRRLAAVKGVSRLEPMELPPTAEEVREIVRKELMLALGVILDAVRRTQAGQGGIDRAWIDLVLDENASLHRAFFGPKQTVVREVADYWHSCDAETPPFDTTLEIAYGMDGKLAPYAAYAVRRGDARWYGWYDTNGAPLRNDLQRPSVWRRPAHQERVAA